MYKQAKLSNSQLVYFVLFGLTLNAFGMGMTVATNLGSAMWTASSVNLSVWLSLPLTVVLILLGACQIIVNGLISGSWELPKIIGNIFVVLFFGSFVGLFTHLFLAIGIAQLSIGWRILVTIVGIVFVGSGISISQRVNLVLHPWDELTNLLRFKYFKGKAHQAQLAAFAIPCIITLMVWLVTRQLYAVNIGTVISFFCQGKLIGWADMRVFPALTHRLPLLDSLRHDRS